MSNRALVVAVAAGLLSTSAAASTAVTATATTDPYKRTAVVVTSWFKVKPFAHFPEAGWAQALLRDTLDRDGAHDMELVVDLDEEFRRGYFEAFDSDGNTFAFNRLADDVSASGTGLRHAEQFSIDITRDYLEAHRATGLNIKFDSGGRSGDLVVLLPATYVSTFLAKVDETTPPPAR